MADVDAEESEQGPELVERVAAIDIAKASGMVCARVPHEDKPGRRVQRVWHVAATNGAIPELVDHLICQGITRSRAVLTHERTRHKQRAEKLPEDAQVKLSSVISDIFEVSGRAMLEALIAGERSPRALAGLAHGTIKASPATLQEALAGGFEEHHAFMLRMLLDTVDYLTMQIDKLTARITTRLGELSTTPDDSGGDQDDDRPGQGILMPLTHVERLDEIPGVGPATAQVILAEIGTDMSVSEPVKAIKAGRSF